MYCLVDALARWPVARISLLALCHTLRQTLWPRAHAPLPFLLGRVRRCIPTPSATADSVAAYTVGFRRLRDSFITLGGHLLGL